MCYKKLLYVKANLVQVSAMASYFHMKKPQLASLCSLTLLTKDLQLLNSALGFIYSQTLSIN
jgi:hypothetical protein